MDNNRFSFSREDLEKVARGALVAAAGAGLVYLTNWLGATDFGTWTPIATGVATVLANLGRKFVTNTA